jgi:hypothetical protein
MPQYFKENGWLTLSAGKIFHTEEGGAGNLDPRLNGPGMPPNNDPVAWHDGLSMGKVNDVANMWGCSKGELPGGSLCAVEADMEGNLADPAGNQLCDKVGPLLVAVRPLLHWGCGRRSYVVASGQVIAGDAVLKLRLAAAHRAATGQPFFMAVGLRKPHLAFRFPEVRSTRYSERAPSKQYDRRVSRSLVEPLHLYYWCCSPAPALPCGSSSMLQPREAHAVRVHKEGTVSHLQHTSILRNGLQLPDLQKCIPDVDPASWARRAAHVADRLQVFLSKAKRGCFPPT